MISSYGSEVINTYPKNDYKLIFKGRNVDKDRVSPISSGSLSNETATKSFVEDYVLYDIVGKNSNPISSINTYFNVNEINRTNFEDYYIAVEYAYRTISSEPSRTACTYYSTGNERHLQSPISYNYNCSDCSGGSGKDCGGTCTSKQQGGNCCTKCSWEKYIGYTCCGDNGCYSSQYGINDPDDCGDNCSCEDDYETKHF